MIEPSNQERGELPERSREYLEELEDEIKRLQTIVDKVPKTADGVPVVPTVDTLFLPFWGKVGVSVTYRDSNGFQVPVSVDKCYTKFHKTREIAEAKEDV